MELKASSGHSKNQSTVQQLTIAGYILIVCLKVSPIWEKHKTMWRYFDTLSLKTSMKGWSPHYPMISTISPLSSAVNRLGTSPLLSRLLMSSMKYSFFIWCSLKRKTTSFYFPAALRIFLRSSYHSSFSYTSPIYKKNNYLSSKKAASLVRLYRPDPPVPTNNPWLYS